MSLSLFLDEALGAGRASDDTVSALRALADVVDAGSSVRIEAYADMGNGMESLTPSVFADVMAAAVSTTENAVMLDVEDYGQVRADQVMKFRK